jgi:hypothetical protein
MLCCTAATTALQVHCHNNYYIYIHCFSFSHQCAMSDVLKSQILCCYACVSDSAACTGSRSSGTQRFMRKVYSVGPKAVALPSQDPQTPRCNKRATSARVYFDTFLQQLFLHTTLSSTTTNDRITRLLDLQHTRTLHVCPPFSLIFFSLHSFLASRVALLSLSHAPVDGGSLNEHRFKQHLSL